jgi:hypothetical protein
MTRKQWSIPEYPLNIPVLINEPEPEPEPSQPKKYPSIWRLKTHKYVYKKNHTKKVRHNDADIYI